MRVLLWEQTDLPYRTRLWHARAVDFGVRVTAATLFDVVPLFEKRARADADRMFAVDSRLVDVWEKSDLEVRNRILPVPSEPPFFTPFVYRLADESVVDDPESTP